MKIVAGATAIAKWWQNQSLLLPFVRILIVMWEMMKKSVENRANIDDDAMCQCSSRPGVCLYSTKAMFSYHKYTHSSISAVGPTIQSYTSNTTRSLQWDNSCNNHPSHCKNCCPLIAWTKDQCLKAQLSVQCSLI